MDNEEQISTLHDVTDESQYDNPHLKIFQYLQTLMVPQEVPIGKEQMFRVEATKYHIISGVLFRRNKGGKPSRRVICHEKDKKAILTALNNEGGNRGKDAIVKKVL